MVEQAYETRASTEGVLDLVRFLAHLDGALEVAHRMNAREAGAITGDTVRTLRHYSQSVEDRLYQALAALAGAPVPQDCWPSHDR